MEEVDTIAVVFGIHWAAGNLVTVFFDAATYRSSGGRRRKIDQSLAIVAETEQDSY